MAEFRVACEEKLDAALLAKEPGVHSRILNGGGRYEEFETPAGIRIARYASLLTVSCDFSELDDDAPQRKTQVEFFKDEPPQVTRTVSSASGHTEKTVRRAEHDTVVAELAKFLNLVP